MKTLTLLMLYISIVFSSFSQNETSILFIGNSFTFMNNMPTIFKNIAISKGKNVYVDSIVQGGKDFNFHANRIDTYQKINARKWDYIILQGHSNELAQPESKVDKLSLPFATQIVDSIRKNNSCTQVLLYMTWGYKNGNPKWGPISTYDSMQFRIKNQYLRFADLLNTIVSPVGEVWKTIRTNYSGINLYHPDNQHPSLAGSYTSACTHFTSIFGESPVGNKAILDLDLETRSIIEYNASQIVLNNLNQWRNIPKKTNLETGYDLILHNDSLSLVNRAKNFSWMEWDFGDGSISVQENPSHVYLSPGEYTVTQKISSTCKTDTLSRKILVTKPVETISK